MRPKPPTHFDITPEGYHDHNRYFNEAEKIFDKIERWIAEECANNKNWEGNCYDCHYETDSKCDLDVLRNILKAEDHKDE